MLRTTRLSSTSITRRVRAVGSLSGIRGCGWATERTSGDADELQFSFERFAIERLHHILLGTRLDRGADLVDAFFGGDRKREGDGQDCSVRCGFGGGR